jgi:hypothetical protein
MNPTLRQQSSLTSKEAINTLLGIGIRELCEALAKQKTVTGDPVWTTVHIRWDMNRASRKDLFLATSGGSI